MIDVLWAAFRAEPGDDTRNALVEHYQPLIKQIVRRFGARLPRTVDRGDLMTAGNVGLISAVKGFDPERGVRFESYCELRVKGALDELRSQDWLPRPWRQKIEQQKRTVEQLRREWGRNPNDSEVASAMGFDLDVYQQTFGVGLPGTPSGSMPADDGGEDGSGASPLDIVQDQGVDAPGDRLSRDELMKLVSQRMSDQERRIVYLKYWEELPMREIGDLTGLSESRVCKIHTRLIDRMGARTASARTRPTRSSDASRRLVERERARTLSDPSPPRTPGLEPRRLSGNAIGRDQITSDPLASRTTETAGPRCGCDGRVPNLPTSHDSLNTTPELAVPTAARDPLLLAEGVRVPTRSPSSPRRPWPKPSSDERSLDPARSPWSPPHDATRACPRERRG